MNLEILKLDLLDKKLLYELDINSRQPLTQLAKKTRSSVAVVDYRLKRMEEAGLIKHYVTLVDAAKLGLMIWNVYLELQNTTEKEEVEIMSYLSTLKKAWWVARCSGNWDLIYSVCVKDIKEFYDIVTDINNKFGKYIAAQNIESHCKVEIISRGYFTKSAGKGITWYKEVDNIQLDENDIKILKIISDNARLPTTEIAKRTDLTARIVSYRIKDLVKKGIITRFRLHLDIKKIGMSFYKAIIHIKDFSYKKNLALKEYCIQQGNIWHFEEKVGSWLLELELDSANYEAADLQMRKMKENFFDFIKSYELLLITDEPKGELDLTKML